MNYSPEIDKMHSIARGPNHGPAPIPPTGCLQTHPSYQGWSY